MKKSFLLVFAILMTAMSLLAQDDQKALVVVDGKIRNITPESVDPLIISSVTVLKDQEAITAYGNAGRNGVIMIQTNNPPAGVKSISGMLVIVEGNEYSGSIDDISPVSVKSVSVLKGSSATNAYGEAGKNGVITVDLKEENPVQK